MKLLGWMHRKFRQNAGDPFRDLSTGNPCNCLSSRGPSVDDDHQSYDYIHSKHPEHPIPDQWMFYSDQEDPPISVPSDYNNMFHGLLTIGTLGMPTLTAGDNDEVGPTDGTVTPTFGVPHPSVEDIAEKEEHTEVDLMLINSELEKILVVPESEPRISSARTSQVSMKQLVLTDNSLGDQFTSTSSCPLQEYLLGSSVDMGDTRTTEQKKEHRRQRTSLGDLFTVEEGGDGVGGCKKEKLAVKVVQSMVKKILKRHESSGNNYFSGGGDHDDNRLLDGYNCNSHANNKFHKIVKMFHKKIHPEDSSSTANKVKKKVTKLHGGTMSGTAVAGGLSADTTTFPVTSSVASGSSESNGNREQWIKTDADYLVLEL